MELFNKWKIEVVDVIDDFANNPERSWNQINLPKSPDEISIDSLTLSDTVLSSIEKVDAINYHYMSQTELTDFVYRFTVRAFSFNYNEAVKLISFITGG